MSDDAPITLLDRLASAIVAGRLDSSLDHRTALDFITALGMAEIEASPYGGALLRARIANDAQAAKVALKGMRGKAESYVLYAHRMANSRKPLPHWQIRKDRVAIVANTAMRYFLSDVCPSCNGERFEVVDGTNRLSARPCRKCNGSGARLLPAGDLGICVGDLIAWGQRKMAAVVSATRYRLYGEPEQGE